MTFAGLALLGIVAFTPANQDEVGGPLRLRNDFPFANIFLSTPPLDARIPRQKRLDVSLGFANCVALPDHVFNTAAGLAVHTAGNAGAPIPLDLPGLAAEAATRPGETFTIADTEVTRLNFVYSHPFGRRWMLEVDAPIYIYGGGFLDGTIKSWHDSFGFPFDGRTLLPTNVSQIGLFRGADAVYSAGQEGPSLGDVTLRGLYNITPARGLVPYLSLSGAVKLPTGDVTSVFGSGTWDGAVGLHLTQQLGQSWLYGTLGYNLHGGWRGMPGVPVRNSVDGHLGYEYRVSREWSAVLGLSYYGSSLDTTESRSVKNPATLYSCAARYNDGQQFELEWGFVENIVRSNNTYDFGIYSRVRFWP